MTLMKFSSMLCAASLFALPASAQQIPKPSPGLMPNPSMGKPLYEKNCASCHGPNLKGTDKAPPFLHRFYEPSHHGDAAFQMAARNGVRAHHWQFGDMAPVEGVTRAEVETIVAFIRAVQRENGIE